MIDKLLNLLLIGQIHRHDVVKITVNDRAAGINRLFALKSLAISGNAP